MRGATFFCAAAPERERGSADPYLGRVDISVAELLARHGDEAAAVGDEVSGTEDTWPLSDPAFKVKSKHLRNRTRRHDIERHLDGITTGRYPP